MKTNHKVILFDLWNTLMYIVNLEELTKKTQAMLGPDRYKELFKQFVAWHSNSKTKEEFLKDLEATITIAPEERHIIEAWGDPEKYELYPETKEVLRKLKASGIHLVLVTNSPPSSKTALENKGIAHFFDKIVFSCDVGLMKPDKAIFEYAIQDFAVEPHEVLMVGDSLEKDVYGALAAGLHGLLLDREGLSSYENKISHLGELVA